MHRARQAAVPIVATAVVILAALGARTTSAASTARGWTRAGLGAVTQPAPVGGRFVLYTHSGGSLHVVALDARDGKTAWSALASPSQVTPGVAASLAVGGGRVVYLAGESTFTRVVARDVATGAVAWRSATGLFTGWPSYCPGETKTICVEGMTPATGARGELRFDAATGKPLASVNVGSTGYPGRAVGDGLYDPGDRHPEVLLAVVDGHPLWRRALSQIFTLKNASTDGGWDFGRYDALGLYVGSVGTEVAQTQVVRFDLANTQVAGFTITKGNPIWRTPGQYACEQLPCPGASEAGYSSPGTSPVPSVALRIVATGSVSVSRASPTDPKVSKNADVVLQGFDPETGRTRWSFDAKRNIGLITEEAAPARIDRNTILLRSEAGYLAIDLRTGTRHIAPDDSPAWCQTSITYTLDHTVYYGGRGQYVGELSLFPCRADRSRRAEPDTAPSLAKIVGATADGLTAWNDAGTIRALPN